MTVTEVEDAQMYTRQSEKPRRKSKHRSKLSAMTVEQDGTGVNESKLVKKSRKKRRHSHMNVQTNE